MLLFFLLSVLIAFRTIFGYSGVDLSVSTSVNDWQCLMANHNVSFATIRAYRNVGTVDTNVANSLHFAAQAGLTDLGVYMFPCMPTSSYTINNGITCPSAEQQVLDTVKFLRENNVLFQRHPKEKKESTISNEIVMVNRVWLDIEDESPAKYYDADPVKNQEFIAQIVTQLEALQISIGIYCTETNWENIMGNVEGYGSRYPLWYPRYDNVDSFDFFVPFADFIEAKIKQTAGDSGYCNLSQVDPDYREVDSL